MDWTPSARGPIYTTEGTKEANQDTYQFLATGPSVTSAQNGFTQVARDYALWQQSAAKYKYKPLFYDMNISVPASLNNALASFASGPLFDMTNNVVRGRNTIADFKSTVKEWQRGGGNNLRKFFEGIREKYGDA